MDLDISWLTPQLAIGAFLPHSAIGCLSRELKLTHVVDLRAETIVNPATWRQAGIRFLHLPTEDHWPIEPLMLARGVQFVLAALDENRRVLIHCQCGIGRSALLAGCVLVASGYEPDVAMAIAKGARPIVSPHPDQLHALLEFSQCWCRDHGRRIPAATWDDLAAIVYAPQTRITSNAGLG